MAHQFYVTPKLSPDETQQMSIERRRREENERKKRIFDEKTRCCGIDVQALDAQVEDRKAGEEKRKLAEKEAASLSLRQAEEAERRAQLALQKTKRRAKQICNENASRSNLESRTDKFENVSWDEAGVSSLVKFEGEDVDAEKRAKAQKQQVRELADDFRSIKASEMNEIRQKDLEWSEHERFVMGVREKAETIEISMKNSEVMKVAEDNKRLMEERLDREAVQRAAHVRHEAEELDHNLNDPLLADGNLDILTHADPAVVHIARQQPKCWAFKGMSRQDYIQGYEANDRICESNRARQDKERQEEAEAVKDQEAIRRYLIRTATEEMKNRRAIEAETNRLNEELKTSHARKARAEKELYSGGMSDSYHDNFGTTTR